MVFGAESPAKLAVRRPALDPGGGLIHGEQHERTARHVETCGELTTSPEPDLAPARCLVFQIYEPRLIEGVKPLDGGRARRPRILMTRLGARAYSRRSQERHVISVDTPSIPDLRLQVSTPARAFVWSEVSRSDMEIHSPVPGRSVRHDTALMRQVGR
jgi:hypothetical protein